MGVPMVSVIFRMPFLIKSHAFHTVQYIQPYITCFVNA